MKWIDAKVQPPEDKSVVLGFGRNACTPGSETTITSVKIDHLRGHWTAGDHAYPFKLYYWMPQPELPNV